MEQPFDFIQRRINELSKRKKELWKYKKNFPNDFMFKKYARGKWKELIEVTQQLSDEYKFLAQYKAMHKPERKRAMFHLSGNHIGCVTYIPERLITKEMEEKEADRASENFDLMRDQELQERRSTAE